MAGWVKKARNILELFSRTLINCEKDTAEAQYALVDIFGTCKSSEVASLS